MGAHLGVAGVALLAGLALALAFVAVYLRLARRWQLVDHPNERSAHTLATPSSGGVALVMAGLAGLLLLLMLPEPAIRLTAVPAGYQVLAGLLVICALGAWDDRRALSAGLRLLVFFLVAALISYSYLPSWPISASPVSAVACLFLLTLAQAWLYNLYNFMDGIDGLAALQCVLVLLGCLLLVTQAEAPPEFYLLGGLIVGVYAGFLAFNWPPARLFMGDAGSLSAGFLLGWLGLWGWRDGFLSPWLWLLLMSPFLLDTGLTLLRRAWDGERLVQAHSRHLYQRLSRRFKAGYAVNLGLLCLHLLWLWPLAWLGARQWLPEWTLLLVSLFPQLFLIVKCRRLT